MPADRTVSPTTKQALSDPASKVVSGADSYLLTQARAVHRIYGPLYADNPIRIILKARDHAWGTPHEVAVVLGNPGIDAVDETYLGAVTFDPLDKPRRKTRGRIATPGDEDRKDEITIIAPIPRQIRPGENDPEKTAPDFQHHPVLGRLMWNAPVLFEQGKYRIESRQKLERREKHSFEPVKRAAVQHVGDELLEEWDTTQPPTILIGFHWLEPGGAEKLAFDSVKWARQAGLRVLVVAERSEIHRLQSKLPDDPQVEFIRADAYLDPNRWFEFLKVLIKRENIRALHIHHNTRLYDNLLRLKAMFPALVTIDSTHIVEHENGGFPRTSGVWTRYIDHHHVISRELMSFYLDEFGVSDRVVLGRMLEPDGPKGPAPDPELRLQTGQKTCRLIFIGRMVHQKRAPLAVAILRGLHRRAKKLGVEFHLDMIGTGAYLDVVRHMISRAGLSGYVTLHPADSDVPALLQKADILLLPSANEGLALVCYEAIENGVIPISTDVGGQSELVADQLLVPVSPLACVRDSVRLVSRLLSDSDFLQECKSETIARYRNLRTDPTASQVLGALYRDIVKGAKK